MSWLYLVLAIFLVVSGTTLMKLSAGFTRIVPSVLMFVFYAGSLASLALIITGVIGLNISGGLR